jgi:peptide/nickel transport system substrate-binding protein
MAATIRPLRLVVLLAIVAAVLLGAWQWTARRGSPDAGVSGPPSRGGELVASLRNEPVLYNRYVDTAAAAEVIALLTHARLVRVNRVTDELEPALAESWTQSADGLSYTLKLRSGVRFSDGAPFTADDVLFTFRALYDERVNSPIAIAARPGGKPIEVSALDPQTVVVKFPVPFAPGLRMLDYLPILPRHKLQRALDEGRFADAWKVGTPFSEIAGLGPFVLAEHVAGQRLVLHRNPHYWRFDERGTQLPYLDTLRIEIITDQNTEALRVAAGEIDLMTNGDIRPEDYATFKRAADNGRLRLLEVGTGLDPNLLWFNLTPARTQAKPWLSRREFRQAVSYAADRQAIVNAVYLGEGVAVYGPITQGNRTWYSDAVPKYAHNPARARELLASIGLTDRNGDGTVEDASGTPVRFSILTQRAHTIRERTASVLQEQLRKVGLVVDVVALDTRSIQQRAGSGDYDAIYYGFQQSSTDPALNPEYWFSSGFFHVWNPQQAVPATDWERRIDDLMRRQTAAPTLDERKRLFTEAQTILAEESPAIYFVAPKIILAVTDRVRNPTPALPIPQLLWNAQSLASAGAPRRAGS